MIETRKNAADSLSVTTCTFADLPDVYSMKVPAVNRKHADRQDEHIASGADAKWYGGLRGIDAARALMHDGWPEGATAAGKLTPKLEGVVPPPKSVLRRVRWSDNGTELHIDRAMSGDWDIAFRNRQLCDSVPRVITLVATFGGNAGESHERLFWCGAQMVVAADLLEGAGYAVELRAAMATRLWEAGNKVHLVDVLVKQPDQPLRPDAVMAVFGHAGTFRSYGFRLITASPYNVGYGLGSACAIAPELARAQAEGLSDVTDYVLPEAFTLDQAAANIVNILKTLDTETAADAA